MAENTKAPKSGEINAGINFDKERAPEGFDFLSNTDPDNVRIESYKLNPDQYVILDSAYTADGELIPGQVAIFKKKAITTS